MPNPEITTEAEWIAQQGGCCIEDCENKPEHVDAMDNVMCTPHMEQDRIESPDNWDEPSEIVMEEPTPSKPKLKRLFNTSDLRIETRYNRIIVPQKKAPMMPNPFYMCLISNADNSEHYVYMNRKQAEQMHRHLGGLLALEDKGE